MYKDVLRSIQDIEIFPIISLILFLSVFVVMVVKIFKKKDSELNTIANSVLNDGTVEVK